MSQGTTFRVIAFDVSRKLPQEEVLRIGVQDRLHSFGWGSEATEEAAERFVKEKGMPRFLPLYEKQNEEDKQYNSYRQKEDPFPLWIDTDLGFVGHELLACDFTSDFNRLEEYFVLQAESPNECVEITREQVREMLQVLDYIKLGKYDRELEEAFFSDNEFFRPLESQFFNFEMRFRNKNKDIAQQTVKIVIEDKRTYAEKEPAEEVEYACEAEESKRDETATIEYLRSVLSTFLLMSPEYRYKQKEKIDMKLAYFKWI